MNTRFVPRDERTTSIENASYRWGYLFLAFGLLLSVAYRGFVLEQSSWDVLALVVLSGVVTTIYQSAHHVLSWRWALVAGLTAALAALVGLILVLLA